MNGLVIAELIVIVVCLALIIVCKILKGKNDKQ